MHPSCPAVTTTAAPPGLIAWISAPATPEPQRGTVVHSHGPEGTWDLHADNVCKKVECRGCLEICSACQKWRNFRLQYPPGGSFEVSLQDLAVSLNALPLELTPHWVPTLADREVRAQAVKLPNGMDHDNCSGSALMLALLRPHLFCTGAGAHSPGTTANTSDTICDEVAPQL